MKLQLTEGFGPLSMSSRVEGDKCIITVGMNYGARADRLPDDWRGPCIEVLSRNPTVYFQRGPTCRAIVKEQR